MNRSIATLAAVLGTFLATVDKVPSVTTALESYAPAIPIARSLLTIHS